MTEIRDEGSCSVIQEAILNTPLPRGTVWVENLLPNNWEEEQDKAAMESKNKGRGWASRRNITSSRQILCGEEA